MVSVIVNTDENEPEPYTSAELRAQGSVVDLYEYIEGAEFYFVSVPEHTDETLHLAAVTLAVATEGLDFASAPNAMRIFREWGDPVILRQHQATPDGGIPCGCADTTTWCEDGDGPPRLFWKWERTDPAHLYNDAVRFDHINSSNPQKAGAGHG